MDYSMKLFSKTKTTWNKPFSEKIAKRVQKIPTGELEVWADQTIYEVGRALSSYQKVRSKESLNDLLMAAEAMHAVIDEIYNRMSR